MILSRATRLSLKICFLIAALGGVTASHVAAQTPTPVQPAPEQPSPEQPSAAQPPVAQPSVAHPVIIQPAVDMQIAWEVRNRFRLFREERDFLLQVNSLSGRSILASEQTLATQSDGRGILIY